MLESSDNTNSATRAARVGQLLDDVHVRQARGEPVDCTALLAAHPDLADSLRPQLELLRQMHAVRSTHAELLARGLVTQTPDGTLGGMIGGYRVTGFIGRGGMGLVLKACDDRLRRPVALKILRPELTATGSATPVPDAATTRFEREARAAASLNHPHIVAVYSVGQDRGARYIAMEYVAGPSLAEVLRDGHCRDELCAGARWEDGSSGGVGYGSSVRPPRLTEPPVAGAPRSSASPDTGRSVALSPLPDAPASPLPTPLVRNLFRQLLEALAAAHAAGLIHRDVKPSNILLQELRGAGIEESSGSDPEIEGTRNQAATDQDVGGAGDQEGRAPSGTTRTDDREAPSAAITTAGAKHTGNGPGAPHSSIPRSLDSSTPPSLDPSMPVLKLADFGLARLQRDATQVTLAGAVLGTPEYMSPEQARGEPNLDPRADLYSAGVVLYEMLTGRTPFRADTPTATLHRILNEEPADPRTLTRDVDPALASLALRLLAKEPADRLASAAEALGILDRGRRLARRSRARRRRMLVGVLMVAATAVLVGLGVFVRGRLHAAREIVAAYYDPNRPRLVTVAWSDGEVNHAYANIQREGGLRMDYPWLRMSDSGRWCVFIGDRDPDDRANLLAMEDDGRVRWSTWLGDKRRWPDCEQTTLWHANYVVCAPLEPNGPPRLVAVAYADTYYGCCVAVIDPGTGTVLDRFWHTGQLLQPLVVHDLLGDLGAPRPGIVLIGANNKLDGFDTREPGDEPHRTDCDLVPVVMVLDPRNLSGVGSPGSRRFPDLEPAHLVAYAFLDVPRMPTVKQGHDGVLTRPPEDSPLFSFETVAVCGATAQGRPMLKLLCDPDEAFFLTPELELCHNDAEDPSSFRVIPAARHLDERDAEFYRRNWHVVIRNGVYQPNEHNCEQSGGAPR